MSKKRTKRAPKGVQPPDKLLDEAALYMDDRDDVREDERPDRAALAAWDTFEARNKDRLALISRAMEEFQGFMADTPGYDGACAVQWDDDGESVYLVEAQDHGVMLAMANPSGEWALYLDDSVLRVVIEAAQRVLARKGDLQRRAVERANALLEDAAQDRAGCGE